VFPTPLGDKTACGTTLQKSDDSLLPTSMGPHAGTIVQQALEEFYCSGNKQWTTIVDLAIFQHTS
jgi:hypothetical protein